MAPSSISKAYFASSSVAVRANGLEVRTMRKDRALDALAAHLPAQDRNDPPCAIAEVPGDDRRADLDGKAEDIFVWSAATMDHRNLLVLGEGNLVSHHALRQPGRQQ